MGERAGATVVLFRGVTVLHAAMTVTQAVAAGAILQASTVGLIVHQAVGGTLLLVAFVQVGVAALAWRPGGLPAWPIGVSAGLVVAEVAQVAVGATGVLAVHIPLGVAIVGTAVGLAVWTLRARPAPRPWQAPLRVRGGGDDGGGDGHARVAGGGGAPDARHG